MAVDNPLQDIPDIEGVIDAVDVNNEHARTKFYHDVVDRLNLLTRLFSYEVYETREPTVNTSGSSLSKGTVYGFTSSNVMAKAQAGTTYVQAAGVVPDTTATRESFLGQNSGRHRLLLEPNADPQPQDVAYLSQSTAGTVSETIAPIGTQSIGIFESTRGDDGRALVSVIMNTVDSPTASVTDWYSGSETLAVGDICYFSAAEVLSKSIANVKTKPPVLVVTAISGTLYQVSSPGNLVSMPLASGGTAPAVNEVIILSDTDDGTFVPYADRVASGSYEMIIGRCVGPLTNGLYPVAFNLEPLPAKTETMDDF